MANRLAGVCALLAFAAALIIGRYAAHNDLATAIARALVAMFVTLIVGYVVGSMAEKMLSENVQAKAAGSDKLLMPTPPDDR